MSVSRRELLAAAAAGMLLGGCAGREDEADVAPPEAVLLARLLAGERAAVAALEREPGAAGIVAADREHVALLTRALGGRAPVPAPGDPLPAGARKQRNVFEYVQALPQVADPELRVLLLRLLASESGHLALLREAAGEEPVPDAFAGFAGAAS